ncbi:Serine/threonine-protein phosphatase 7 long form homolog [Linum perenne]
MDGLLELREVVSLVSDTELITTLVERCRPKTNIFHLYDGKTTITLEDVEFIMGLCVDGRLIDEGIRIPSKPEQQVLYI